MPNTILYPTSKQADINVGGGRECGREGVKRKENEGWRKEERNRGRKEWREERENELKCLR